MTERASMHLNPISFLQTFVTQSVKLVDRKGCGQCDDHFNYIEVLGLTASSCFEAASRRQLGYTQAMTSDQYADVIINIKNQIGGGFSRASSEAGVIRVQNTRCPFGAMVKEAPELCRMTSSVFGGIAARNFGYAKVELRKRIATNDGKCDVCIYTEPELARDQPGDEYHSDGGSIVSRSARAELTVRVAEKMERAWCQAGSGGTSERRNTPKIIAESQVMREALEAVEVVAPTMANVFISGETGVGKEVIARAIHALSERAEKKFVAVNCGAIPENLIESVLFGHEKGAFTGAYNVHHGFFERAEGATLFLDEIDSLPVSAQAKLLRVLQEGEFERVGGRQMLRADARIVAASNHDIEQLVAAGDFRKDLYYRLNVVPIHIPPLRERREDITVLVNHFLQQLSEKYHKPKKMPGDRAWNKVMTYDWPGNVRELENVLERAFLFARGQVIENIGVGMDDGGIEPAAAGSLKTRKRMAGREIESRMLQDALTRFQGNVSAVAREIGITPRAVHQKLKAHSIDAATYRRGRTDNGV